jgi:hypothetical protein
VCIGGIRGADDEACEVKFYKGVFGVDVVLDVVLPGVCGPRAIEGWGRVSRVWREGWDQEGEGSRERAGEGREEDSRIAFQWYMCPSGVAKFVPVLPRLRIAGIGQAQ